MANNFHVFPPSRWKGQLLLPYSIGFCGSEGYPNRGDLCYKCRKIFENTGDVVIGVFTSDRHSPYNWFHYDCFWENMSYGSHPINVNLVLGIDQLPPNTQELLMNKIISYQLAEEQNPGPYGGQIFRFDIDDLFLNENKVEAKYTLILITSQQRVGYGMIRGVECHICSRELEENGFQLFSANGEKKAHYRCALKDADMIIGAFEDFQDLHIVTDIQRRQMKKIFDNSVLRKNQNGTIWPFYLRDFGETEKTIVILSTSAVYTLSSQDQERPCEVCKKRFSNQDIVILHNFKASHFSCVLETSSTIVEKPDEIPRWKKFPEWMKLRIWDAYNTAILSGVPGVTFPRPAVNLEQVDDRHDMEFEARMSQLQQKDCITNFCKSSLSTEAIENVLKANQRRPSENQSDSLFDLIDLTMFGKPGPCPICNGYLVYNNSHRGYVCCGSASVFTRCQFFTKTPGRFHTELSMNFQNCVSSMPTFIRHDKRLYAEDKTSDGGVLKCAPQKWNDTVEITQNIKKMFDWDNNYTAEPANFSFDLYIEGNVVYHAYLKDVDVECVESVDVELMIFKISGENLYHVVNGITTSQFDWSHPEAGYKEFADVELAKNFFKHQFFVASHQNWEERDPCRKTAGSFFFNECNYQITEDPDADQIPDADDVSSFVSDIFSGETANIETDLIFEEPRKFIKAETSAKTLQIARDALLDLQMKLNQKTANDWDYTNTANVLYSLVQFNCDITSVALLKTGDGIEKALQQLENIPAKIVFEHQSRYKTRIPRLMTTIQRVDCSSNEWAVIENYMKTGIGPTHDVQYQLMDILSLDRESDPSAESLAEFGGDTLLLWHGSKTKNIASILQNGFWLPTGERKLMYGNGIYFADVFSKSLFYSIDRKVKHVYVLLCAVTMGSCCEALKKRNQAEVERYLRKGFHSIKAIGANMKSERNQVTLDGVIVPTGELNMGTDVTENVLYSEYVVYNKEQIRIKYVVKVNVEKFLHRKL